MQFYLLSLFLFHLLSGLGGQFYLRQAETIELLFVFLFPRLVRLPARLSGFGGGPEETCTVEERAGLSTRAVLAVLLRCPGLCNCRRHLSPHTVSTSYNVLSSSVPRPPVDSQCLWLSSGPILLQTGAGEAVLLWRKSSHHCSPRGKVKGTPGLVPSTVGTGH